MTASVRQIPASQLFRSALAAAPQRDVSVAWLVCNLQDRSFGAIMLLLGLVSIMPGLSVLSGLLLLILGVEMMLAHEAPALPAIIAERTFSFQRMSRLIERASLLIDMVEKLFRPRWHAPFQVTKRLVGVIVVVLAVTLCLPIPLSNIIPGALITLIAVAYLEEDGILLSIALSFALPSLLITWGEGWAALKGADLLFRL